jgi:hypothetical protein
MVAITDPQANLLHTKPFEVVKQVFLCLLIFPISDIKSEQLPFSTLANTHERQNGHFTAFIVVDHGEIGPIDEDMRTAVLLFHLTLIRNYRYNRRTNTVLLGKPFYNVPVNCIVENGQKHISGCE